MNRRSTAALCSAVIVAVSAAACVGPRVGAGAGSRYDHVTMVEDQDASAVAAITTPDAARAAVVGKVMQRPGRDASGFVLFRQDGTGLSWTARDASAEEVTWSLRDGPQVSRKIGPEAHFFCMVHPPSPQALRGSVTCTRAELLKPTAGIEPPGSVR